MQETGLLAPNIWPHWKEPLLQSQLASPLHLLYVAALKNVWVPATRADVEILKKTVINQSDNSKFGVVHAVLFSLTITYP